MSYWRLFYHMIWATKHREPLIPLESASALRNSIAAKAANLGASVYAVGGIEDHVHLVVSVPPTIALSEFVRQVKGSSSHFANHELELPAPFNWQSEYGILSFDSKPLDKMIGYVKNQQQHHVNGTTIPILERVSAEDQPKPIAHENGH